MCVGAHLIKMYRFVAEAAVREKGWEKKKAKKSKEKKDHDGREKEKEKKKKRK